MTQARQWATTDVLEEVRGGVGFITLNRSKALNALSLAMVRAMYEILLDWKDNPAVKAIAIRGSNKEGPFGAFCAGGDIRFFHQQAEHGNPEIEDFFTEEYTLNNLIPNLGKPYIAFMDGIVMGGGMGISQGGTDRILTERTRMAMPETLIGLFPDVGGGYFLSRCPGHTGEWLGLAGDHVMGGDGLSIGWGDHFLSSSRQAEVWQALGEQDFSSGEAARQWLRGQCEPAPAVSEAFTKAREEAEQFFGAGDFNAILKALEAATDNAWAQKTAQALRKRSPLMLHVVFEQIRRARGMTLAEDLRMERDLVRHCFFPQHMGRKAVSSEIIEGIRALVVDKDNNPQWDPPRVEDVTPEMIEAFFESPWPASVHPLASLK